MKKDFFLGRYKKLGGDVDESVIVPRALRINTLKISEEDLLKRLKNNNITLERIPYLKHGFKYTSSFSLGSTPEYLQGLYYLQEAASQIPAEVLDPKETDLVLDMCAAPGSKTTQMAQLMNNKGTLIAVDSNVKRLESLNNNLERMGITNVTTFLMNAKDAPTLKMRFDKILLDAPCSGNYCIEENWFDKRDLAGIKINSDKQKALLDRAFELLHPGGILVYSTCSLEPEEDEQAVDYADALGFELIDTGLKIGSPVKGKAMKLWPHLTNTQGFFIAKFRKPNY